MLQSTEEYSDLAKLRRCGVLIGNYWKVWKTVVGVRWRSNDQSVVGIAHRAEANIARIQRELFQGAIVCSFEDDIEAGHYKAAWNVNRTLVVLGPRKKHPQSPLLRNQ